MVSGCWRPHTIRNTVRTVYVLPTILALLYALQDTTWTPVVVCFTTFCFFFNFSFWINGNNHFVLCQNLWGISLCTIIGASATSRGTKRGVYSINFFGSLLLRSKKFIVEGCVNFSPYKPFLSSFFFSAELFLSACPLSTTASCQVHLTTPSDYGIFVQILARFEVLCLFSVKIPSTEK